MHRPGHRAGLNRLDIQSLEIVDGHLVELAEVEAREPLDSLAIDVGLQSLITRVEGDMANRQQEMLRFEPATRINDGVIGTTRLGIDDEALDRSEFFAA